MPKLTAGASKRDRDTGSRPDSSRSKRSRHSEVGKRERRINPLFDGFSVDKKYASAIVAQRGVSGLSVPASTPVVVERADYHPALEEPVFQQGPEKQVRSKQGRKKQSHKLVNHHRQQQRAYVSTSKRRSSKQQRENSNFAIEQKKPRGRKPQHHPAPLHVIDPGSHQLVAHYLPPRQIIMPVPRSSKKAKVPKYSRSHDLPSSARIHKPAPRSYSPPLYPTYAEPVLPPIPVRNSPEPESSSSDDLGIFEPISREGCFKKGLDASSIVSPPPAPSMRAVPKNVQRPQLEASRGMQAPSQSVDTEGGIMEPDIIELRRSPKLAPQMQPSTPSAYRGSSARVPSYHKPSSKSKEDRVKQRARRARIPSKVDSPGRVASQLRKCRTVLRDLMNRSNSAVFCEPVDPVRHHALNYFDIIKNPMDFGTVLRKLDKHAYSLPEYFASDMHLVFDNATRYNAADHPIHTLALKLKEIFNKRFTTLESVVEEKVENYKARTPDSEIFQRMQRDMQRMKEEISRLQREQEEQAELAAVSARERHHVVDRSMSYDEKRRLSLAINSLSGDKLGKVVQIIQKHTHSLQEKGRTEIEIDLDALNTATLRELESFVQSSVPTDRRHHSGSKSRRPFPIQSRSNQRSFDKTADMAAVGIDTSAQSSKPNSKVVDSGAKPADDIDKDKPNAREASEPSVPKDHADSRIEDLSSSSSDSSDESDSSSDDDSMLGKVPESAFLEATRPVVPNAGVREKTEAFTSALTETSSVETPAKTVVEEAVAEPLILSTSTSQQSILKHSKLAQWGSLGSQSQDASSGSGTKSPESVPVDQAEDPTWSQFRSLDMQRKQREAERAAAEEELRKAAAAEEAARAREAALAAEEERRQEEEKLRIQREQLAAQRAAEKEAREQMTAKTSTHTDLDARELVASFERATLREDPSSLGMFKMSL